MYKITYKNLDKSDLVNEIIESRIQDLLFKFSDLKSHRVAVRVSMDNSPVQVGPDSFTVQIEIQGDKFKNIFLEKTAPNLYKAVADLHDGLLERLNRKIDKVRVKSRKQAREVPRLKLGE